MRGASISPNTGTAASPGPDEDSHHQSQQIFINLHSFYFISEKMFSEARNKIQGVLGACIVPNTGKAASPQGAEGAPLFFIF